LTSNYNILFYGTTMNFVLITRIIGNYL